MMTSKKVKFITLGCRVNQYETQGMREVMSKSGVLPVTEDNSDQVDFVIINTCTVTAEADKENRYWIRRAKRDYPTAKIVVTGCGVERDREKIEALPEVDLVVANHDKSNIADKILGGCADDEFQKAGVNPKHRFTPLSVSESEGHARAFIKIQDGCNHACSFCKVVLVRGRSRSRNLTDILDEVKRLRDGGFREVVFAGIQLGAYGLDSQTQDSLVRVIEESAKISGIERIRLSSIEPTDVKPELINALAAIPQCGHHLHIPLQSGDDQILAAMNRRYDRVFYIDLIERLRAQMPDFMLTMDVMAGFPGEEETHFCNTLDLIGRVKPIHAHSFPYSEREGTKAARLKLNHDKMIARERVLQLSREVEIIGNNVRQRFIGKTMPVLVENYKQGKEKGWFQGLTLNYLKVYFPASEDLFRKIVPVELVTLQADGFLGRIVES